MCRWLQSICSPVLCSFSHRFSVCTFSLQIFTPFVCVSFILYLLHHFNLFHPYLCFLCLLTFLLTFCFLLMNYYFCLWFFRFVSKSLTSFHNNSTLFKSRKAFVLLCCPSVLLLFPFKADAWCPSLSSLHSLSDFYVHCFRMEKA